MCRFLGIQRSMCVCIFSGKGSLVCQPHMCMHTHKSVTHSTHTRTAWLRLYACIHVLMTG